MHAIVHGVPQKVRIPTRAILQQFSRPGLREFPPPPPHYRGPAEWDEFWNRLDPLDIPPGMSDLKHCSPRSCVSAQICRFNGDVVDEACDVCAPRWRQFVGRICKLDGN